MNIRSTNITPNIAGFSVELVIASMDDLSQSAEHLTVRVLVPHEHDRNNKRVLQPLEAIQLAALQNARAVIAAQIQGLQRTLDPD